MYKEFREQPTSPSEWEHAFLPKRDRTNRILRSRLLLDPRWREFRARVPAGGTVLDAGCGLGEWVLFLRSRGFRADGLDYAPAIVDYLKERYPDIGWLNGQIQEIPASNDRFDSIISWGVIEHDEAGPQAAVAEFYRVLKPGGWVFASVPFDSDRQRSASLAQFGPQTPAKGFFQYFYTKAELGDLFAAAGFRIDSVVPCSHHWALAYPRLYMRSIELGPNRAIDLLAKFASLGARFSKECTAMILAIAQKPG
jgi:ubiquinone/menaquinone biosynthesis C-methylase UbiE